MIGPALTELYGWKIALLTVAAACALFTIMLETLRTEFDSDRDSNTQSRFAPLPLDVLPLSVCKPPLSPIL
ncbi:MAG: hypothetical protein VW707_04380 [Candidatus Puniceispirillum sp.]